jgi:hypothetical protein
MFCPQTMSALFCSRLNPRAELPSHGSKSMTDWVVTPAHALDLTFFEPIAITKAR